MKTTAKHTTLIKAEAKRMGFLSCGISKAEFLEDEAPFCHFEPPYPVSFRNEAPFCHFEPNEVSVRNPFIRGTLCTHS